MCVAVTSLPDASPMCTSQFGNAQTGAYKAMPVFPKAFSRALQVLLHPSEHITCGDMVFSGHTVFFVLASLVCKEYLTVRQCDTPFTRTVSTWIPRFHTVGRWAAYTLSTAGIVAIVGTRLHYTLDVVIAIYITWRTWGSYHERCDPRNKKYASRIIRWLEARTVSRKTILAEHTISDTVI